MIRGSDSLKRQQRARFPASRSPRSRRWCNTETLRSRSARRLSPGSVRSAEKLATYDTPRDRLLGVFDWLAEGFARPELHGCAFTNATAEGLPGGPAQESASVYRDSVRSLFSELAEAAGAVDLQHLSRQAAILYDGATVAARMDRNHGAGATAREIATTLVDAATGRDDGGIDRS